MTKETPITVDQITIKTLRALENNLVLQRKMTQTDDETDASLLRIRRPVYTPPPPRPPYQALIIFGLVATGFFAGVWTVIAWSFLL